MNHKHKKQKRQILSEEEYSSTLERIITRDYFPSVTSLQRDASILQKRAEGDFAGAVAIRRAAREKDEQEEREKAIEHEQELAATKGIRIRPRPLKEEDITGFHTRVTSEDNAHFEKTMKEEAQIRKETIDLMYNKNHFHLLKQQSENEKLMHLSHDEQMKLRLDPTPLLASDEFNPRLERIHPAGGASLSARNSFFFTPEHQQLDDAESMKETLMLTSSDDQQHHDSLMPPPTLRPQSGESSLPLHLIPYEYKTKPTVDSKQKMVVPSNTRFDYQNESRLTYCSSTPAYTSVEDEYNHQHSSMMRQSDNASALHYDTESSSVTTDLDDLLSFSSRDLVREREERKQRIQQERNHYVTMTPVIIPGKGRDSSPLMTFGRIASTPLVVSSSQHDIYKLPEQDHKESIANKAQLQLKHKSNLYKSAGSQGKQQPSTIPITSISTYTPNSLTPAAQTLLQRSTLSSSSSSITSSFTSNLKSNARSGSAFGSALRSSYTPISSSMSERRHSSTTPAASISKSASKLRHVFKATPLTESVDHDMKHGLSTNDGSRTETTRGLMQL